MADKLSICEIGGIAVQLQAKRIGLGMPYRVLARRCGHSVTTVKRILTGRGGGYLSTLDAIAEALGEELVIEVIGEPKPSDSPAMSLKRSRMPQVAR